MPGGIVLPSRVWAHVDGSPPLPHPPRPLQDGGGRGRGRGGGGACLAVQFARGGAGCSTLLKSGVGELAPQKLVRVTLMRPFHGNL